MESKAERRQSIAARPNRAATGGNDGSFKLSFVCGRLPGPRDLGGAGRGPDRRRRANLSGGKVKVGVLTDIAGPTAMANGKGSVIAAEMAAEDFGAGLNVEVISADHQGKPDVGSQIAARWFDVEGVDAIADMQGSPIGFAVQNLAAQKSKIMLLSGSTSSDFNGKACSPLTVQWTVDTYNLAKGAAKAVIEAGGTKWYFLTVDQAYGHALSRDTSEQVKLNGGQVVGNSVFPPNTSDFASFLLTASNAGANVIAIAASSGDTVTALKQADEFGLSAKAKIVPLQSVLTDMHAVGLKIAHDAYEVSPVLLGPHAGDARLGRALLSPKPRSCRPASTPASIHRSRTT